jgi:hypothetical protein
MTTEVNNQEQHAPKTDELEVSIADGEQLDIVVEDDTPEADRNRKPLQKDALAETDDEAEQYSAGVRKRLGELRHQAHDERREKERAIRERDEAVRLARVAYERSKALEQQLQHGEASYASEVEEKANIALERAKEQYRTAYDAGDASALAESVAAMAEAKQQALNAKRWTVEAQQRIKNSSLQKEESAVDLQQSSHQQAPIPADPRAVEWASKNSWFGSDEEMTSLAYGVHEKLIRNGTDPIKDAAKYYTAIDTEMRRRFPGIRVER